jgi:hypothetical protein
MLDALSTLSRYRTFLCATEGHLLALKCNMGYWYVLDLVYQAPAATSLHALRHIHPVAIMLLELSRGA